MTGHGGGGGNHTENAPATPLHLLVGAEQRQLEGPPGVDGLAGVPLPKVMVAVPQPVAVELDGGDGLRQVGVDGGCE